MKFDLEDYLKSNLEQIKITSKGQLTAICPWCRKTGKFYIHPKTGNYCCFSCRHAGRRAVGLVAHLEGLTPLQAKAFLFRNILVFRRKENTESLREKMNSILGIDDDEDDDNYCKIDLPPDFIPVYDNGKWRFPKYLKSRGIKRSTAKKWKMGFCNFGRYAGRIVIPFSCPNGRSFVTRAIDDDVKPKVLDPKNSNKSSLFFGWDFVDIDKDLTIVEGPFDCVLAHQNGLNVLSLLGKVFHEAHFELLKGRPEDAAITIMLDPEEQTAPIEIANKLLPLFSEIYIAKLPDGTDPGSATKKQLMRAYNKAQKYDGLSSRISLLKNQLKNKK